jgi:hypothetical protein
MVMSKSSQVAIVSDHFMLQDQPFSLRLGGQALFRLISAMGRCFRHCVECSRCLTRYLVGFSPYPNGSYLVPLTEGASQEWILYCSCCQPPTSNRCSWSDLKMYVVCSPAHDRGYGRPEEIIPVERRTQFS